MPKPAPRRQVPWRIVVSLAMWILVAAGVALAARQVRQYLREDPHFTLHAGERGVTIEGVRNAPLARINQVFAADIEESVFQIPLDERRRRLLAIDWVEDASLTRLWPNRLVVRIRERTPVAFVRVASRYLLIDAEGFLLSPPPRVRFDFPVMTGITGDEGEAARKERVQAMQALVANLGPAAKQISEVDVSQVENLRITTEMDRNAVELWMGDRNFSTRYQHFISHYPEIKKTSEGVAVFDLRLDDRITTRDDRVVTRASR
jgi:cell division protein FtsQ